MIMPDVTDVLFVRIGGATAVDRLVDGFYRRMETQPQARGIRAMHPDDLGKTKEVLKRYLTEWTGGPRLYSPEKGHPRLRRRHMGYAIGTDERDAWLLCMSGALEEVIEDEAARAELYQMLTQLADWMRNQVGNPHDTQRRPQHTDR